MRSLRFIPVLAFLLACDAAADTRKEERPLLKEGEQAPDLVGEAADGTKVRLSEQKGHPAVVYFYPKDATPGCTIEACAFRDAFDRYQQAKITVFGVSSDSAESHRAFRKQHQLPFPLVADEDGRVQHSYGVRSNLGMAERVTFLIGPAGEVAHVWPDVDPGIHANEVLTRAAALTAAP